jgi:D-3-phosphoglycerate dehydrogenase
LEELFVDRFKVVQVIEDRNPRPDWLAGRLADAGVDYSVQICWTKEDLEKYAADADVVWSYGGRHGLLEGDNLKVLKKAGAILRTGSGTDNIDKETATELGIIVVNTPHAVAERVADHTISLLFSLVREITRHDRLIRSGQWDCWLAMPSAHDYRGATLGLVGFGRIPQFIVKKLVGFKMNVLAYDPYVDPEVMAELGVESVDLDDIFRRSDYVSLHCPLTDQTCQLVGERELRMMKPKALLVNTARGAVVDEAALIKALEEGWIAGAAMDVLEKEPPVPDNPILQMANVIFTPHVAGLHTKYPEDFAETSVEAILDLKERRWPRSVVNPDVKPRWGELAPRDDQAGCA